MFPKSTHAAVQTEFSDDEADQEIIRKKNFEIVHTARSERQEELYREYEEYIDKLVSIEIMDAIALRLVESNFYMKKKLIQNCKKLTPA